MLSGERDLEAELEDLMSILAESELESEVEAELTPAQRTRAREVASDQIRDGVTDENRVTDAVFYDLNPTWKNKKLPPSAAKALRDEWTEIRNRIVRPLVKEMSCSGWERDPQSFAKRAAEHHLKGSGTVRQVVQTANPPNWACNVVVDGADGSTTLTVQFSPAEKLVRVGPASGGPMMCYQYRCVAANVVLQDAACPGPASEFEAELEDLMSVLSASDMESEAEMFTAQVRGPIFDLQCTACAAGQCVACQDAHCAACPVMNGDCRSVLSQAISEAIGLARNAAGKIDAAIRVAPARRDAPARQTADIFTSFFCHDPLAVVPWAGGPSGIIVARRLRAVADELDGGRRMRFVCRDERADCRQHDPAESICCAPTDNAFTVPGLHSTVFLCPQFWAEQGIPNLPEKQRRAATIIHEMLHNLYDLDDEFRSPIPQPPNPRIPTPRRFDAHCYEAFVLQVNGFGVDQADIDMCGSFPCPMRI